MTTISKKLRREIFWSQISLTLTVTLIAISAFNLAMDTRFDTPLSAAVPDGLRMYELSGGAFWLLMISFVGKYLALLAIPFLMFPAASSMLRGEVFTKRNSTLVTAISFAVLIWGIFTFVVERIGNNLAAHQLGIDYWYDIKSNPDSNLAFWVITLLLIALFSVVIKRGITLEEDVDGLV